MNIRPVLAGLALAALIPMAPVWATPKPDQAQADLGASSRSVEGFDHTTLHEQVDLGAYAAIFVSEPTLELDDRWRRDHRHDITERDEARIRSSYTRTLHTTLKEALVEHGLRLAEEADAQTLVVEVKLADFRLTAPDLSRAPFSRHFVDYVGSGRLELTLRDGADQRVLGTMSDSSRTRSYGAASDLKETNRAINLRDFKWLFKKWSDRFARFIAEQSR